MIRPPAFLKRGPKWLRDFLNEHLEYSIKTTPLVGAGLMGSEFPRGFMLSVGSVGGIATSAETATHPWQPYEAPFTGEGDPPADQGRRFKIRPGYVSLSLTMRTPSNKNEEFTAPADNADGYLCWLECTIGLGTTGNAEITGVIYNFGSTLPDAIPGDAETGTPPSKIYIPLFYLFTDSTSIDAVNQIHSESLKLQMTVEDITCSTKIRTITLI